MGEQIFAQVQKSPSTIRILDFVYQKKHLSQKEIDKNSIGLNLYVPVPRTEGCAAWGGKRENSLML